MSPRKNINGIQLRKKVSRPANPHPIVKADPEPIFDTAREKVRVRWRFTLPRLSRSFVLLFGLIVAVIIILSFFERTLVVISPYSEAHTVDEMVSVHKNPSLAELGFDIIALHHTEEIALPSSGVREVKERASATIRIFNEYSTSPQRLIEATRFETPAGKIYLLPEGDGVVIPGKEGDTPGSVDVKVFAQTPGEAYNGPLTDLTIPGFKEIGLDEKYEKIYARSLSPFEGGGLRLEPVISNDTKDEVQDMSHNEIALALQDQLEREKTDDFVIIEGSERIDLHDIQYLGEKKKEQLYEQKGSIYALMVRKDDLKAFLVEHVLNPDDDLMIETESLGGYGLRYTGPEIDYEHVDSLTIHLQAEPIFVWQTDTELLKTALFGLTQQEAEYMFHEFPSIASADLKIRPFWKRRVSRDMKHIKVK